jgi:hypothetical protein
MRYTQDMNEIMKLDRYKYASKTVDSFLRKREPDFNTLVKLCGRSIARDIIDLTSELYSDPEFKGGVVREQRPEAPILLSKMIGLLKKDKDFIAIYKYFTLKIKRNENPNELYKEIDSCVGHNFHNKFGPHASQAMNLSALVMHYNMKRKSGISMLCHWIGTTMQFSFLESTGSIPKYLDPYSGLIIAFAHDSKEELLKKVPNGDGKPYGIIRAEEFSRNYLPRNVLVERNIDTLTNIYCEMVKEGFENINRPQSSPPILFNVDNFKEFISQSMDSVSNENKSVYNKLKKMHSIVSRETYKNLEDTNLLSRLDWDLYNHYLDDIIADSIQSNDDTPRIVKFCDLKYNFVGKGTLSDQDLGNTLLKVESWASKNLKNVGNDSYIKYFAEELLEDTLQCSKYNITRDIMRRELPFEYYGIAFQNIIKLQPILYEKVA